MTNFTIYQEVNEGFFQRPAPVVAAELPGMVLVHRLPDGGELAGRIIETEAYTEDDPASHSFPGLTPRNRPMFAEGGTIYVYRSYGIHLCFNLVTGRSGDGQAVLIRALEPLTGIPAMGRRRGMSGSEDHLRRPNRLTGGPGRLTVAMGIGMELNGRPLGAGPLVVRGRPASGVIRTTRIGISRARERPWRFLLPDNPWRSRPAAPSPS